MNCMNCGKEIKGVVLDFGTNPIWVCSNCNNTDVACSESGTKLIYNKPANLIAVMDQEVADEHLIFGKVYEVDHVYVGGHNTQIYLKGVDANPFNSCLFSRVPCWEKNPLGLRPRYVSDLERKQEIQEAMKRYIEAKISIPCEWVSEYLELSEKESKT